MRPTCDWCRLRPVERGAKYCSHSCRQRAYEHRKEITDLLAAIDRAARHLETLAAMLRISLSVRHAVKPPVHGGPENAHSPTQRT
jgi:hypothetical protein